MAQRHLHTHLFHASFIGHTLKVTGARLVDEGDEPEVESMGGGYSNALDASELYFELRVIDALRDWKESTAGHEALSGRHEKSILETRWGSTIATIRIDCRALKVFRYTFLFT